MANPTTNYGFVLPTPTDLVTDLPADFDVALQGVDTRLKALQPGTTSGDLAYSSATANTNVRLGIGTAGQILSVVSGVPAWVANDVGDITAVTVTSPITGGGTSGSVGIAIQDALTTQKGAVQLSDSVSTTSSILAATPTAVKTANDNAIKSTGGLAYITGRYYQSAIYAAQVAASTYAANVTYYVPFYVRETRSFAKIAILSGTAFVGTASIRLAIYNSTSSLPSTVVIDAGLVAPTAATTEFSITINQSLSVGQYFLAINTVTAATTNSIYSHSNPGYNSGFDLGGVSIIAAQGTGYLQSVNVSTGFATAVSPAVFASNIPLIKLVA